MTIDWIIMNILIEKMNIIHNDDDAPKDDDDDDDGEVGGVRKKNDLRLFVVIVVEGNFILKEYYVCTWCVLLMDVL